MRSLRWLILGLLVFFTSLYVRTLLEARSEINLARKTLELSNIEEGVDHYRKAIAWNSPGNWYSKQALSELTELIFNKLDGTQKLEALRQLIRGIQSSRNFTQSWLYPERVSNLDRARQEIEKLVPPSEKLPRVENLYKPQVNYSFQILAQICFILWIGLTISAICNGMTKDGHILAPTLAKHILCAMVFFAFWLICLRFA